MLQKNFHPYKEDDPDITYYNGMAYKGQLKKICFYYFPYFCKAINTSPGDFCSKCKKLKTKASNSSCGNFSAASGPSLWESKILERGFLVAAHNSCYYILEKKH
jgi:hypothetical protein